MNLTLFFTEDWSVDRWHHSALLSREVALYHALINKGVDVNFVTYGSKLDTLYTDDLKAIRVYPNRWLRQTPSLYKRFIALIHGRMLRQTDVIKTNQLLGGNVALRAARFWNKPLIIRCGYLLSNSARHNFGAESPQVQNALILESKLFHGADHIILSAPHMADQIKERLPHLKTPINIIPNYVDDRLFSPPSENTPPPHYDLIYVGRLHPRKNLLALMEGLAKLDASILIIGKGEMKQDLYQKFETLNRRITWLDAVDHKSLPGYLHRAKVFILPSLYEGHPKALIEAMMCGMAVIGANVGGIREVITHGKNGWLCDPNAEAIKQSIRHLLDDASLRARLGANARRFALQNYGLAQIAQQEYDLLNQLTAR